MAQLTLEQLKAKVERWGGERGRLILLDHMEKVAEEAIAYSRRKHLSGGTPMPRGVTGGFDNSTLASKTGLRHRITKRGTTSGKTVTVKVGTDLNNKGVVYPRLHEYGIGKMPERPWLRPSIKAKQSRLLSEVKKAWVLAYDK